MLRRRITRARLRKSAKASAQVLPAPAPVLEPKAIEILKAACARLAAAHSMSFTAVISYENPSRLGPPLIYTVRDDVTLERPDKLKVITPGDGPANEFYYDGKTMSAFAPAENLIAVASAPSTRRDDDRLLHRAIARDGRGHHRHGSGQQQLGV